MNLSIWRNAAKSGIRCLPAFNELLTFVHYRASSRRPMQCKFIKKCAVRDRILFFRRLRRLRALGKAKICVCRLVLRAEGARKFYRRCTFSCNFARPLNEKKIPVHDAVDFLCQYMRSQPLTTKRAQRTGSTRTGNQCQPNRSCMMGLRANR